MNTLPKQDAATPPLDSNIRLIPLTKGQFAIVDATDFDNLNQNKWFAHFRPKQNKWYVMRHVWTGAQYISIYMHREILCPPPDLDVDHRDANGLNNLRSNLRIATPTQNSWNTGKHKNNKSGHKGVSWDRGKWRVRIKVGDKYLHLGRFSDLQEAASAYQETALRHRGEFARMDLA